MTTFDRSGHWRTNAQGSTYWVSGHVVSRDDWAARVAAAAPAAPRPASPIVASGDGSSNITIPNASCPVCGATVFFFKAADGGRVFFDPPLGPPWPKHPCTISERVSVSTPTTGWKPDAAAEPDILGVSVHPRTDGTVLGLHSYDDTIWIKADLDLRRTYFERAWPERDAQGAVIAVHLIDERLDPVRLDAAECAEPSSPTAEGRIDLSRIRVADCLETLRRIPGTRSRMSGFSKECGAFAVGMQGRSRIAVLFAAVDTTEEEEHVDDHALADVARRWNAVRELLATRGRLEGDYLQLDRLVVITDDPLGRRTTWFDTSPSVSFEGVLRGLGERDHWMANVILDDARVGEVVFAAAGEAPSAKLEAVPISCDAAHRHDESYSSARWGNLEGGRWKRVRTAMAQLGNAGAFEVVDGLLKKAGWRVNHETASGGAGREHPLDVVYIREDLPNEGPGPSLRLNYELSSLRRGVAMVALGGKSDEATLEEPLERHLHFVRTKEDVTRMTAAIGFSIHKGLLG